MTIFERIVAGEIPCHKVWESDEFLAFLDIRPVAPGHTLVIPKNAIDPVFAMDDEAYQRFLLAAKKVAEILKTKIHCERICMSVVGFEVPHAHIHLIPARGMSDFPWPGGAPAKAEDLAKLSEKLRAL
ncbi:MAG: HIT family protein [Deltaproteobacteria bacterium]|nr:HIT family protein [Deltaproteobacteria bacterium]